MHDVDKDSLDRGVPHPNHSDQLLDGSVKSHKTISTHYTTDADSSVGRLQMENKQIVGNDGTTNITLYGYNQALGKWGFFVTKPGVDVTTNTDLSQFIFNSNQNVPKIVASGIATFVATAGTGTAFAVDLTGVISSPPLVIASALTPIGAGTYFPLQYLVNPSSTTTYVNASYWVNYTGGTKELRFNIDLGASAAGYAGTWNIKYYVFQESVN